MRSLLLAAALATPAVAGNTLVPASAPVAVARSPLTVTPAQEWNRLGAPPGKLAETWTLDGDTLNALTFYGGIPADQPLFREVDHATKPLPRFAATMLLSDVPVLVENSYRVAYGTALMAIETVAPATVAGRKGVHFTYAFTRDAEDEVRRRGEGWATIDGGKLYLVTFEAPATYYFDAGAPAARAVAASAALGAGQSR